MAKSKSNHNDRKRRLLIMFGLTFAYMVAELIVGYIGGSIALVADSFHMLSDVISLIVAFISMLLSPKRWKKSTFGWARAEVLGALVNSVFLMALCFSILMESIQRFIFPKSISEPRWVLGIGIGGFVVNLIGLFLFHEGHGHSHKQSVIHHQGRLTRLVVPESYDEQNESGITASFGEIPSQTNQEIKKSSSSIQETAPITANSIREEAVGTLTLLGPKGSKKDDFKLDLSVENPSKLVWSPKAQNPSQNSQTPLLSPEEVPKAKSTHQLNMHGVWLHIMADTMGSVIVIISASIIWATEEQRKLDPETYVIIDYIDPALSVIMVFLIVGSAWPLLQEASMILLQTIPTHIQIEELKRKLMEDVPQIIGIHDFHIWQLAGDCVIASIHIVCHDVKDYIQISKDAKYFFHLNGIHSTTIQAEFLDYDIAHFNEKDCLLDCPKDSQADCSKSTCCKMNGNQ